MTLSQSPARVGSMAMKTGATLLTTRATPLHTRAQRPLAAIVVASRCTSVIVLDSHVIGSSVGPDKRDPPLLVDPDAALAARSPFSASRRHAKRVEVHRGVEHGIALELDGPHASVITHSVASDSNSAPSMDPARGSR